MSEPEDIVGSAMQQRERAARLLLAAEQAQTREQARLALQNAQQAQGQQPAHDRNYEWHLRPAASPGDSTSGKLALQP